MGGERVWGWGVGVFGQGWGGGASCPRGVAIKGDGTRFHQHTRLLIQPARACACRSLVVDVVAATLTPLLLCFLYLIN